MTVFQFNFDEEKNYKLQKEKNISFEEIICLIEAGNILDILEHPNREKYGHQKIFVLDIRGYVWLVSYVAAGNEIFLKTAYPSRKFSRLYSEKKL